jgi:hypothetical protein
VCTPETSCTNWCIAIRIDFGAETCKIRRAAECDEHFSGDRRAAAEEFCRRAITFGRTLRSNHREAQRHWDRDGDRGDHDGDRRTAPAFHEAGL